MNNPAHQPPKLQSRTPVAPNKDSVPVASLFRIQRQKKKEEDKEGEKKQKKRGKSYNEEAISDERCERVDRLISRAWKKVDDRVTGGKRGNALIGQRLRTHIDLRRWLLECLRGVYGWDTT